MNLFFFYIVNLYDESESQLQSSTSGIDTLQTTTTTNRHDLVLKILDTLTPIDVHKVGITNTMNFVNFN